MTKQALNSIELFKGNSPSTIEKALSIQNKSVVEELKAHFGAANLKELSVRLSMGR